MRLARYNWLVAHSIDQSKQTTPAYCFVERHVGPRDPGAAPLGTQVRETQRLLTPPPPTQRLLTPPPLRIFAVRGWWFRGPASGKKRGAFNRGRSSRAGTRAKLSQFPEFAIAIRGPAEAFNWKLHLYTSPMMCGRLAVMAGGYVGRAGGPGSANAYVMIYKPKTKWLR